jgi:chromosome segregation ATPase
VYENKIEIINELNDEISNLSTKLSRIVFELEEKRKDIQIQQELKLELEDKVKTLDNSINILRKKAELESKRDSLVEQLATVTTNMEVIKQELERQNILNSEIANLDKEIRPASDEKDKINFSLKQLEEYNLELASYNESYSMIELIKKYSSPTKGGIQTLFMQLYMGKTISMANELLSLLFDGKFELLPYIINESEFRIPCMNKESSVYHDDISSCSSAERAMISMMISFSLLHHSSTVYNILRLDEIDGALDQNNRSNFLLVLQRFMKALGVENCIMISHSSEMDMSNADIIQLTPVDNNKPNGNIIFTYND